LANWLSLLFISLPACLGPLTSEAERCNAASVTSQCVRCHLLSLRLTSSSRLKSSWSSWN
jgi:hypothetical protein